MRTKQEERATNMSNLRPLNYLHVRFREIYHKVYGPSWFPHVPITLLVFLGASWLIYGTFGKRWPSLVAQILAGDFTMAPSLLPPVIIGGGLLIMAFGLAVKSRTAWTMALILIVTAIINLYLSGSNNSFSLFVYFIMIACMLMASWKTFDHANLAASTLFAISSIFMLFCYAAYGSMYLGADFRPPITDLVSALYFSTVTMTTVGYGDITPQTPEAKLFTISLIVLGVAVFATSLTAIVTPLLSRSMDHIANRGKNHMKRENHFVVLGDSILAQNTYRELKSRGQPVIRVLRQRPTEGSQEGADVVVGDAGESETLKNAGCDKAIAILAMFEEDAENAFAILAVRELGASGRTVAAVNNPQNLNRIRLVQPDVVIAPQILGGELAAMLVCGEDVTAEFVINRVFHGAGNSS